LRNNKNIVWLASYPKSGNTWVRIFLSNYLSNSNNPVDINSLEKSPIFSNRVTFDEYSPIFSSDLKPEEIDKIRNEVYIQIAKNLKNLQLFKIHDSLYKTHDDKLIVPSKHTFGAVYIIRNPLDIAVSFAFHSKITFQKSCDFICNPNSVFSTSINKMDNQIRQILNSWSGHVISWTEQKEFPILIIKYEDLIHNAKENFEKILNFLKVPINNEKLLQSLEFSSFKELQNQEKKYGFKEKPIKAETFFRKGESNAWKKELSKKQSEQIINSNFEVMQKYHYI